METTRLLNERISDLEIELLAQRRAHAALTVQLKAAREQIDELQTNT